LSLVAIFLASGSDALARALARVKLDWASLGVDLRLEPLSPAEFEERWRSTRDYDLIAYAYDLYPGFTDFDLYGSRWDIRRNAFGWNPGGYANPEADEAIAEYLASATLEDQRRSLRQLQQAVDDDPFGLWLGFPGDPVLVAADVLGFQPNKVWQTANTSLLWRVDS
jgi:ABC-type transport system substrate-binding protein